MAPKKKRKEFDAIVSRWLTGYRRQRVILFSLGSIGSLVLSIPVLIITWCAIWGILFLPMMGLASVSFDTLTMTTWIGFGLIFVAYLTSNRQHLERMKFDEVGPKMAAARFAARVAGRSSLALFMSGPNTMHSQVKMLSLLLLTGPALIGLSWRMAMAAITASRMDTSTVSEALTVLLAADRRTLVDELAQSVGAPNPCQLLRELLLIDGVILLTTGDPSLTLTDSLRTVIAASKNDD